MKMSFGPVLCAAIIGAFALSTPALAKNKTAKECQAEWQSNKAANEAKKITEKAYVAKCKTEAAADEPKAKPAAAKEESAKDKKSKEKAPDKMAAPTGGKKTEKECKEEWSANKAANQAKKITEKAYVETCREGGAASTTPMAPATKEKTAAPAAPMAPAAKEKTAAPAAPMAPAAKTTSAPATGSPSGANQFAAEAQAKAHCPSGLVVWANLESKIYHFSGHDDYGHTKKGAYICEKDAMSEGMRAAKNEKHP
jgi:hypothetical protein